MHARATSSLADGRDLLRPRAPRLLRGAHRPRGRRGAARDALVRARASGRRAARARRRSATPLPFTVPARVNGHAVASSRRAACCSIVRGVFSGAAPPSRAARVADRPSCMFPRPRTECASVEHTIGTPASTASRTCSSRRSSRSGRPLTSSATPVSSATSSTRSRSSAFGGRWLISRPVGWLRQRAAGWRIASTTRAVSSSRGARWPAWSADLHPVELREHVVGQVERAVREDVALDAAQDPERRELLVRGGDLLGLAPHVVGVEAGDDAHGLACGRRSRGTRSRSSRAARRHLEHASPCPSDQVVWQWRSPRICRELDERRRRRRGTALAQLGRARREAERAVDVLLVGGVRERLERRDVARREPVARTSSVPNRAGSATTSSTGTPSTVTPTARSLRALDARRRSAAAPRTGRAPAAGVRRRARRPRAARDESRQRRGSPATSPPSASAISPASAQRPVQRQPAPRPAAGPAASSRLDELRLGLRADPGHAAQAARRGRGAELVGGADAERRADLDHPRRARCPSRRPSPTSSGRARPLELGAARRSRRSRRARAAAPRSRGRSRAARGRGRRGRARRPARASRGSARPRAGTRAT